MSVHVCFARSKCFSSFLSFGHIQNSASAVCEAGGSAQDCMRVIHSMTPPQLPEKFIRLPFPPVFGTHLTSSKIKIPLFALTPPSPPNLLLTEHSRRNSARRAKPRWFY